MASNRARSFHMPSLIPACEIRVEVPLRHWCAGLSKPSGKSSTYGPAPHLTLLSPNTGFLFVFFSLAGPTQGTDWSGLWMIGPGCFYQYSWIYRLPSNWVLLREPFGVPAASQSHRGEQAGGAGGPAMKSLIALRRRTLRHKDGSQDCRLQRPRSELKGLWRDPPDQLSSHNRRVCCGGIRGQAAQATKPVMGWLGEEWAPGPCSLSVGSSPGEPFTSLSQ